MPDGAYPIAPPGAPLPLTREGPMPARPEQTSAAPDEVTRAAREFEAMFLAEMMAPMFQGLDTEGLGGGGLGEQIFRPMLVERYAQAIAQAGGVGLADSIVRELTRLQTMASPEASDGADR
jgi:Rod binding domain-containing protein